jgi:hypothetical protein
MEIARIALPWMVALRSINGLEKDATLTKKGLRCQAGFGLTSQSLNTVAGAALDFHQLPF